MALLSNKRMIGLGRNTNEERPEIAQHKTPLPSPDMMLGLVESSLDDDKAQEVTVIELSGKSSIADFMVIASGTSSRQVVAMAEHLVEKLKHAGTGHVATEGINQGDWVLIDAGDIIIHLFRPEVRSFYNLEKMWDVAMPEPAGMNA